MNALPFVVSILGIAATLFFNLYVGIVLIVLAVILHFMHVGDRASETKR
jgi:hypothetical protein